MGAQGPKFSDGTGHSRLNNYMHVDQASDNVLISMDAFVYDLNVLTYTYDKYIQLINSLAQAVAQDRAVGGFHFTGSADEGQTWSYNKLEPDGLECPKMFSGPPTAKGPMPVGQSTVTYFMAPAPFNESIPPLILPNHQSIYRSLDGGATWKEVSKISLKHTDNKVPLYEWVQYGCGVVDKNGTVYLGYRRGNQLVRRDFRRRYKRGNTHNIRSQRRHLRLISKKYVPGLHIMQLGLPRACKQHVPGRIGETDSPLMRDTILAIHGM